MRFIKTKIGTRVAWMRWGEKHRWISLDASFPVWWKPRLEKYSFGRRVGWLIFAIGTGVVTKEIMDNMVLKQQEAVQVNERQ